MKLSAAERLSSAKSRALSTSDTPRCADTVRKMRFHVRAGLSAQYRAEFVWKIVRVALLSEPIAFTSLKSVA